MGATPTMDLGRNNASSGVERHGENGRPRRAAGDTGGRHRRLQPGPGLPRGLRHRLPRAVPGRLPYVRRLLHPREPGGTASGAPRGAAVHPGRCGRMLRPPPSAAARLRRLVRARHRGDAHPARERLHHPLHRRGSPEPPHRQGAFLRPVRRSRRAHPAHRCGGSGRPAVRPRRAEAPLPLPRRGQARLLGGLPLCRLSRQGEGVLPPRRRRARPRARRRAEKPLRRIVSHSGDHSR